MKQLLTIIALAAFAAFFSPAHAAEVGDRMGGMKTVCDTEAQWAQIWNAHKTAGYQAAVWVMEVLAESRNEYGEPVCGRTNAPTEVVRIVDTAQLDWPVGEHWTQFVEWKTISGRQLFGVVIVKKGGA